jgi:hypothetical protein
MIFPFYLKKNVNASGKAYPYINKSDPRVIGCDHNVVEANEFDAGDLSSRGELASGISATYNRVQC